MVILLVINLIILFFLTFYSGSSAVFSSLILFQVIGVGTAFKLANKNKTDLRNLLSIFFVAFIIYMLYALVAYLDYAKMGAFSAPDHLHFFEIGDNLGRYNSIKSIFNTTIIDRYHRENEGAHFLFGSLAFIANKFFDGNSVLYQTLHVSFLALLVNLFVYKILTFYVNHKSAFKYTIIYLTFAYILARSPWIVRDNHIALFYVIGVYMVHLPFSLKRLIILLFIQVITLEFRFEHGVAFTFFPLAFLYLKGGENKYRRLYYLVTSLVLLVAIAYSASYILSSLNTVLNTVDRYSVLSSTSAEESGGLGTILYRLPIGIKQLAILVFSQITPFPPWYPLENSQNFYQTLNNIFFAVSPIFWGYVVYVSVTGFKKNYKQLPRITKWLVILAIIFLLANTANMNLRRIMAVYPIIYIVFVYIQSQRTKKQINKSRFQYATLYIGLIMMYSVMKFL